MSRLLKCLMFITISLLITGTAHADVWTAENSWTPDFEDKYVQWINESFTPDIFMRGKWAGLETDCADAVYTARLIYSYENKLPFVIKDPTGSPNHISNKMSRFDDTHDQTQRVKNFIEYINEMTDTKSLVYDTYPVAINRDQIKTGTIWLRASKIPHGFWGIFKTNTDPGHTETVMSVEDTGSINLMGSTVPAKVRNLISTTSLVFPPYSSELGFRRWVLPQNLGLAQEQQPGFSLEQFSMGATQGGGQRTGPQFEADVQAKLANRTESKDEVIARMAKDLCSLATSRVEVVNDGISEQAKLGGSCMNADEYDSFSTPSRDLRIKQTAQRLATAAGAGFFSRAQDIVQKVAALDDCALQISASQSLSLKDYVVSVLAGRISSDPNDSLEARWGLAAAAKKCPAY